jgi:hypothetical protein
MKQALADSAADRARLAKLHSTNSASITEDISSRLKVTIAVKKKPSAESTKIKNPESETVHTPLQVAPSYGNLRNRANETAAGIQRYCKERWKVHHDLPTPIKMQDDIDWNDSNGAVFEMMYWPDVKKLRDEFAESHFRVSQLDQIVDRHIQDQERSKNLNLQRSLLNIISICEVSEGLMALVKLLPSESPSEAGH